MDNESRRPPGPDAIQPPRPAARLLTRCLPPGMIRETVLGDLREMHEEMAASPGDAGPAGARARRRRADRWYWSQTVRVGGRYLVGRLFHRQRYRALTAPPPVGARARRHVIGAVAGDLRFTIRSFRRTPGFTLATVLVLGLGIGSISLMFSTLNTVVLQPLPYPHPDRLVWVWSMNEQGSRNSVSYLDYVDYQGNTDAFESLGTFTVFSRTRIVTGGDAAESLTTYEVSSTLFATLGVAPDIGRSFVPEDEQTGGSGVAIVSHGLWERRFGGDPAAIGSTITLNGEPAEIVGVMPAGFEFPAGTDVWFPLQQGAGYTSGRGNNNFYIVGRLRDGVTIQEAQSQMTVVAARIADANPAEKAGRTARLVPLHERYFGSLRTQLLLLVGVIALVPLVAGANVAALVLARATTRRTELASRLALGASRARVIQQLLTESLAMALCGGAVGLALAFAGGEAIRAFAPAALPRLDSIGIDARVAGVTLLVSLAMVPLVGILPALRATDLEVAETLKAGGGRRTTDRRSSVRSVLVVAQVALSVMLMLASGLLARSFVNLQRVDPGFRSGGVLLVRTLVPSFKYENGARLTGVWDELHGRVLAVPGVEMVGAIDRPPLSGTFPTADAWAEGRPPAGPADTLGAVRRFVTEDYFRVMRTPIVAGRAFDATDGPDAPLVAVINEAAARQFFPGEDAVGRTLVLDWEELFKLRVVGVSADIREIGLDADPVPTVYLSQRWYPRPTMNLTIRTSGDPLASAGAVRQAIRDVDDDISIADMQTMDARLSDSIFQPRFQSVLVGLFALVALVLSSIGLYGVLALLVRQRGHEISVRLALGADAAGVVRLVIGQGARLVSAGVLVGVAGGLAGSRLLRSALVGVGPADPITYGAVVVSLIVVTLVACLGPALRAARLDPAEALKAE